MPENHADHATQEQGKPMRSFGRWFGRLRREFLGGLHGGVPPRTVSDRLGPDEGRTVVVRRTTIEEIQVHEPPSDDR